MKEDEKIKALIQTMNEPFYGMYIPRHGKETLARYVVQHIKTGSFLGAVLENNLTRAVAHADNENIRNIPAYVAWLYNYAPLSCWGSRENLRAWLKEGIKDD